MTGEHRTRTNRQAVHACTEECCAYAPKPEPDEAARKSEALAEAKRRYRETHSREGYPLGGPEYPDNREGRRRLARTWKGHQP